MGATYLAGKETKPCESQRKAGATVHKPQQTETENPEDDEDESCPFLQAGITFRHCIDAAGPSQFIPQEDWQALAGTFVANPNQQMAMIGLLANIRRNTSLTIGSH